jgi:NADPH:quinone reductase-like Zn-dependent oxidoreductase
MAMWAVRVKEPGGPETLVWEEVPDPEPGPGQVRIRVRAAGINHRDIWVRQGNFGAFPEPMVLGSDAAGEVDAVGPGVVQWQPKDRVVVNPGLGCGSCVACRAGHDNVCLSYRIMDGAYAEYWVVPEHRLTAMPSGLTFEEAAAIGVPYITAEEAWIRANAMPGETALIWGASGGLGLAALQLAKTRGVRVLAVTRRTEKADRLLREGADDVLIWEGNDIGDEVRRRTGGMGPDLVLDSLGSATLAQSLAMAARGGRVVTVGATTGGHVDLEAGMIFRRLLTVIGAYMGSSAILPRLLGLFGRGLLKPVIDSTVPLREAAEAHRRMEAADLFGKIILVP